MQRHYGHTEKHVSKFYLWWQEKNYWCGGRDVNLISLLENHILQGTNLASHLDKQRNSKCWVLCTLDEEVCSYFSSLLLLSIPKRSHYFTLMHCQMDIGFLFKRPHVTHIHSLHILTVSTTSSHIHLNSSPIPLLEHPPL